MQSYLYRRIHLTAKNVWRIHMYMYLLPVYIFIHIYKYILHILRNIYTYRESVYCILFTCLAYYKFCRAQRLEFKKKFITLTSG